MFIAEVTIVHICPYIYILVLLQDHRCQFTSSPTKSITPFQFIFPWQEVLQQHPMIFLFVRLSNKSDNGNKFSIYALCPCPNQLSHEVCDVTQFVDCYSTTFVLLGYIRFELSFLCEVLLLHPQPNVLNGYYFLRSGCLACHKCVLVSQLQSVLLRALWLF